MRVPVIDDNPAWLHGWWMQAHRLDSPNKGLRPATALIDTVILHSISLPPGQYGGQEVQALFTNNLDWNEHPYFQEIHGIQVSAHFYIRRDGLLWQFVSCDDRAWHAGQSSFAGRNNCNDYSIGIELEGLEGHAFEPEQYMQLAELLQHLRARYPIAQVLGHEHVAPGRKFDPGPGFDWSLLQQSVVWPLQYFPALSMLRI
jgi:N-acetyl-anhydromuramoyl-L-alanine amidase